MNDKKSVSYYAGIIFGMVLTACIATIMVGATVKILYWMF